MAVNGDGEVRGVVWEGIAFDNDIITGQVIEAVNGKAYSGEVMQDAITAAKDGTPIELLVKRGEEYRTVSIDYTGGLRWPWLVKQGDDETLLDRFLRAKR